MSGFGEGPLGTKLHQSATAVKYPKPTRVKNKTSAQVQITAEQIVREAKERQEETYKAPKQKIQDAEELAEYRLKKRKEFEDLIRRVYWNEAVWVKYAKWEESQKDFPRARSVWERALDHNYRSHSLWLKYAEMEMSHKFVNHARNVWDRAVKLLPRVDQFWYKYIHMEEMMGQIQNARMIFERWMNWEPDHNGWNAYIKMETRYKEWDRVRKIYERYVQCHPSVKAWVRWAKFEMSQREVAKAREVYELAVESVEREVDADALYVKFAQFEELCKEPERARAIYKYALDNLPKEKAQAVYQNFMTFEKQYGNEAGIDDAVLGKKRVEYEDEVRKDPTNYDAWFDYTRLEENAGEIEKAREVYERAIANVPPATAKQFWRRYIYLWINYALFEELEAGDLERAREVYRECLKLIPHKVFSFSKIWVMASEFEIRQKRLDSARKILGLAIGLAPKDKIFKVYIDMEMQLGNVDRCRTLYQKHLEIAPHNCFTWEKFAELENSLGETERARAIFEIAIARPVLDMPEVLWKAYVDFEIGEGERARARDLYERLLDRTQHVKVWMSYAQFEAAPMSAAARGDDDDEDDEEEDEEAAARRAAAAEAAVADDPDEAEDVRASKARAVYERALLSLKEMQPDAKEERVMLLEAWKAFEESVGSSEEVLAKVEKKLPRRVKRKRPIYTEDGTPAGQEEYYDYIFPEEQGAVPNLKILEAAHRWKKQKLEQEGGEGE